MQRHVTLKGVHPVSSPSSRLVLFSLYGATRDTMYRQFFDVHPVGCNTFIVVPWSTKMVFFLMVIHPMMGIHGHHWYMFGPMKMDCFLHMGRQSIFWPWHYYISIGYMCARLISVTMGNNRSKKKQAYSSTNTWGVGSE